MLLVSPRAGAEFSACHTSMSAPLRIALILDPLSVKLDGPLQVRVKWGDHAPKLAAEFLGRGHHVRGFGAPPGLIPRSTEDPSGESDDGGWSRLRAFHPEVIVAYDALSPAAMRGARMARKLGAALVLLEPALPSGGPRLERFLHWIGERLWGGYVRRTAGAVVALDDFAVGELLKEGFDREHIHVIPYGVDTSVFRPGLTSPLLAQHRVRGRILLYVGKLAQGRGVDTLLEAFARTVGQRNDWHLVIAGSGPLAPSLHAQSRRLGIASSVTWLPRPRREELPGLMGASTLLAVPAEDEQVMGRQLGRALACGLPALVSDRPRLRRLMEDSRAGLLVESGSIAAWVEAIERAASSPVARKRWALEARRFAEERLCWSCVAARFETVLYEARARVEEKLAQKARAVAARGARSSG